MSYLYKRSNLFWHFLIRTRLTAAVWRPLVETTRRRHIRFRRMLMRAEGGDRQSASSLISAGV